MSKSHLLPWTAAEIIEATRGELLCGDLRRPFSGISIDSRNISAGQAFVAITGDVHDGHSFIPNIVVVLIVMVILQLGILVIFMQRIIYIVV